MANPYIHGLRIANPLEWKGECTIFIKMFPYKELFIIFAA